MATKASILGILEENRGGYISGETIAKMLNISRSAVWKNINMLREDGYSIKSSSNLGYYLDNENDILSKEGISPYLNGVGEEIHFYREIGSTNTTAKQMALEGAEHGTVVIADMQTAGRGRRGRSFYSPAESGIYMSIILKPNNIGISVEKITAFVAVIVCRCIERVIDRDVNIKWINDIFIDGKKVGGILTEAISNLETQSVDWIVVGIGLNISTSGFPKELCGIAGNILRESVDGSIRNRLAAYIINDILSMGSALGDDIYNDYERRLNFLGNKVLVIKPTEEFEAIAVGIDSDFRLIIKRDDGSEERLFAGEISIKKTPAST